MSDLIKDFFNPNKELRKIVPRRLPCGGAINPSRYSIGYEMEDIDSFKDSDFENDKLVESYRNEEEEVYRQKYTELASERSAGSSMEVVDELEKTKNYSELYANYRRSNRIEREPLLIDHYQQKILNMLEAVGVIVIQGPTGCGKSTQVPQFILNDCMLKGIPCNIVVTQPRRIAAVSVAQRVTQERHWPLGSIVGYKVSLDQKVNEETLLLYCTTGVLLRRLIATKSVSEFTHIILDEVHERDQEMEFLMLTVRKLRVNHPKTKVILMSATFDSAKFANYFKILEGTRMVSCPVIDVKKEQTYRTDIFYLNQMNTIVSNLGALKLDFETPKFEDSLVKVCERLICIFDKLEMGSKDNQNTGSVLVFVPGMHEIEELYKELKATKRKNSLIEWKILPLHSSITIEEQRRIFDPVEKNVRKIILSTNIAESSLTVPNVGYVIDFCLSKALIYNRDSKFTSLQMHWASVANLEQRAGRTGRVCHGRVYRLITRELFEKLKKSSIPEILRCPLDRLILMAKILGMGPPKYILSLAMDAPNVQNIRKTVMLLKEAGALISKKFLDYEEDDSDAEITFLGKVMADLPLDIYCTKLIILGFIFDLLEEAIIIATAISIKSVFSTPFDTRLKAYMWKLNWADGSCSDLIAFYNVYRYSTYVNSARQNPNRPTDYSWARRLYLQKNVLREWNSLISEVKLRLGRFNLIRNNSFHTAKVLDNEQMILLKVIIAGAFYPNYFYRQGQPTLEKDAVRALNNCDPFTSVYLSGIDQDQPKELYVKSIKNLFRECANEMDVFFDMSKKIFVQFRKSSDIESISIGTLMFQAFVPGKVANEVYRAVRMRQLKMPFDIKVMNAIEANKRMQMIKSQRGGRYSNCSQDIFMNKTFLPKINDEQIEIRIAHVIDPGHFFGHYCDEYVVKLLKHLFSLLNDNIQAMPPLMEKVKMNGLYAALFKEKDHCGYYRARVVAIDSTMQQGENVLKVKVQFIDFGNVTMVNASELRTLPAEALKYESIAVECRLAEIKPSKYINDKSTWTKVAIEWFINATRGIDLIGRVYSVVNKVVNIELFPKGVYNTSINKLLVLHEFAIECEEDYLSKVDHEERKRALKQPDADQTLKSNTTYNEINFDDIDPPLDSECVRTIMLKGPFSPLEIKLLSFMDGIHEVNIDQNSVNAVLLDTEPSDIFDRLYVSSSISENRSGSILNLRYVTAMPSVPGFMTMMGMIFAPYIAVKRSQNQTRIGSIVCGLGHDKEYKSLLPEHDIVMNLDVEFDMKDLQEVNNIRFHINRIVERLDNSEIDDVLFERSREKIKQHFFNLLKRKREYCLKEQLSSEYIWRPFPDDIILKANADDESTINYVWPLHKGVRLYPKTQKVGIYDNVEFLKRLARGEFENEQFPVVCKACDITLFDRTHIRDHIVRKSHTDRLESL